MVQTVQKVTRLLELFSAEDPEWGVSEAGRALGLPKSTTFELMNSLAIHGLLRRTGRGRYLLGWRLFEFGQTLLGTAHYRSEAHRMMWDLAETWREMSQLAVLDGIQALYLENLQPAHMVRTLAYPPIGTRLPAHCSGVGKVLLAHQEWDEIVDLIEHQGMTALTPNTITTLEELGDELEDIRERGYGYEDEEAFVGLHCVAAPVYDARCRVIAALSLSVPAFRFRDGNNRYAAALLQTAGRISSSASQTMRTHVQKRDLQKVSQDMKGVTETNVKRIMEASPKSFRQ